MQHIVQDGVFAEVIYSETGGRRCQRLQFLAVTAQQPVV